MDWAKDPKKPEQEEKKHESIEEEKDESMEEAEEEPEKKEGRGRRRSRITKKKKNPRSRKKAEEAEMRAMFLSRRSERMAAGEKIAPAERNRRQIAARWERLRKKHGLKQLRKYGKRLGGPPQEEEEGMMYAWSEELPPASASPPTPPLTAAAACRACEAKTGRLYMYEWLQGRRRKEIEKAAKEERQIHAQWKKERIRALNSKRFAGKFIQEEVEEEEEGWGKADQYDRRWVVPEKKKVSEVNDEDEDEDMGVGVGGGVASASASASSSACAVSLGRRPRSASVNPGRGGRGKKQMTKKETTEQEDWEDEDEDAPPFAPPAAAAAGQGASARCPKKEPMKRKNKPTSWQKGKGKPTEVATDPFSHLGAPEDEEEWEVQEVVGYCTDPDGKDEYLVDYEGDNKASYWTRAENMSCDQLAAQFFAKRGKLQKKQKGICPPPRGKLQKKQ
uniref:Chromo domain-containing protein n=1 Tax=Chromera velia CCMP2878 TaxID=1169474 RepID=A0A0G4F757_9ALVE|eukprot:Cvel_2925.t1-p1 / transcript=Cvel_2925.t1 / gene=Cvel_2925 / organism=Chromera_velia_CCMP2878 / gene_product=hypothetical protein / transcript_product=hypothetical protein / location=Cvel_scaffold115:108390-110150(+) / protein_length=447 / sequence_SO=supercontig / SO=protein_coding / is_pseudo=false